MSKSHLRTLGDPFMTCLWGKRDKNNLISCIVLLGGNSYILTAKKMYLDFTIKRKALLLLIIVHSSLIKAVFVLNIFLCSELRIFQILHILRYGALCSKMILKLNPISLHLIIIIGLHTLWWIFQSYKIFGVFYNYLHHFIYSTFFILFSFFLMFGLQTLIAEILNICWQREGSFFVPKCLNGTGMYFANLLQCILVFPIVIVCKNTI